MCAHRYIVQVLMTLIFNSHNLDKWPLVSTTPKARLEYAIAKYQD